MWPGPWEKAKEAEPICRRELNLTIQRVELRMYRRTRTSTEIHTRPPHFVYIIRCQWEGDPLPREAALRRRPRSASPRTQAVSPRDPKAPIAGFEEPWPWWDPLPSSYTVRRRWHDIVRFHDSLRLELANDPVLDCRRVKAKVPVLPSPADVDSWLKSYAATNDACALGRTSTEVSCKELTAARSFHELGDLHWMYCHNRLVPYFKDATKVLEEVPTEVLASSRALRRFVTGGVSGRPPPSALPVPPRFLGKLLPVLPEEEELARVAREFRKSNSLGALASRPRTTGESWRRTAPSSLMMNSSAKSG